MKSTRIGKGNFDFEDDGRIRPDTPSTKEFKMLLRLPHYFSNPNKYRSMVRELVPFYKLKINIADKEDKPKRANVTIEYMGANDYKFAMSEGFKGEFEENLPMRDYRLKVCWRKYLVIPQSKIIEIKLNKNQNINLSEHL
jgi:hypothetical protein